MGNKKTMTAQEFKQNTGDAWRAAYKGDTVIINNDRFPDVVFEITARERGQTNKDGKLAYTGDKPAHVELSSDRGDL